MRLFIALALALVASVAFARMARAADEPSPSVLVVEGGCGDVDQCLLYWLGETPELVADDSGHLLVTATKPAWWSGDDAPSTFVLYGEVEATRAADVAWALDQIRAFGAEPRTFVVAFGPVGLEVRAYAEDLALPRQSGRADIVGCALVGTPNAGYSTSLAFPETDLWVRLADTIGADVTDLVPQSSYLSALDGARLPNVAKSLVVEGNIGDLAFGATDGAAALSDLSLASSVSTQVQEVQVPATISRALNLTSAWQPFTSPIDYPERDVDAKLVEQLSAMECYEISSEVQEQVAAFYKSYFLDEAPVTHASYVVLYDLSGSMNDPIDQQTRKLDAARQAMREYLHAMGSSSKLPLSAPLDVTVIGFAEEARVLATTCDAAGQDAIAAAEAQGETDIGLAFDAALKALADSPTCAAKRILILSDGASTQGQTEDQILAGTVAQAKGAGIVIDAIGFGDVGESNADFLRRVTDEAGGTYYPATDTYTLRTDFLTSYYDSLGSELADVELTGGGSETDELLTATGNTSAIQFGIVSEQPLTAVELLRDGEVVDEGLFELSSQDALTSIRCLDPAAGSYAIRISGDAGQAHVFAVRQQGVQQHMVVAQPATDNSLILIIVCGAALLVGVVATIVFTGRRRSGGSGQSRGAA